MGIKVLFFGTHPKQFNGYSKVVYELMKVLEGKDYLDFQVFGFQNFYDNPNHRKDIPKQSVIYDAASHEDPKQMGFGFQQIKDFVLICKPDVCVIYNDILVIYQVVTQLKLAQETGLSFKIVVYLDQVYLNQKKEYIDFINKSCDHAIMFTQFWEKNIVDQGLTLKTSHLQHGFNKMTYFPIPKNLARQYYGLKSEDFIILNLNRNQPRKRWDICLKAFAEIVSRHPNEPIKLLIATALQGAWNLLEIFERELKKRNLTIDDGMRHLIIIDNPQKITDEETNILYNVADIGINTCDGEGFGLCQFEEAALGIPQIVPRLGGFIDYLDDSNAILIDPKLAYYVDNTRDMVCGEALLCDYMDFVEGIELYYENKEKRLNHGQNARKKIIEEYDWNKIGQKFVSIITEIVKKDDNVKEEKNVDDKNTEEEDVEEVDMVTLEKIKQKTKKKLKKRLKKTDRLELLKLKQQIETLLQNDNSRDP